MRLLSPPKANAGNIVRGDAWEARLACLQWRAFALAKAARRKLARGDVAYGGYR
jgi:hypothetical protein